MIAVGYAKQDGVLVFRNSFGPGCGIKGYVGVTFEYLRERGAQALTIELP